MALLNFPWPIEVNLNSSPRVWAEFGQGKIHNQRDLRRIQGKGPADICPLIYPIQGVLLHMIKICFTTQHFSSNVPGPRLLWETVEA
jgi:hypothetical protein